MYSGLVLTKHSGVWIGAHQRFNRIAYRIVEPEITHGTFPSLKEIQHFEGVNGPDGLKRKSTGKHEPNHFYDPWTEEGDVPADIKNHYRQLVVALKKGDIVRSGFEASWLAHVITDGLTPAHHYPYSEHLEVIRGGNEPASPKDKFIVRGETKRETVKQTWKLMGAKGLLSSHMHFEIGVAAAITGRRILIPLDRAELRRAKKLGASKFFKEQARVVGELKMYDRFLRRAWTVGLARQARRVLAPTIAQTVAIVWLMAYEDAGFKIKSRRLEGISS